MYVYCWASRARLPGVEVMLGATLATVTTATSLVVPPSSSVTRAVTSNTPLSTQVWFRFCALPVVVSAKFQFVMLAIEVVLAATDPVPTFVFDEVDAGVGGASATEIGRRLAKLAQRAQVIVVTHLAQVAAFSNNHLVVEKGSDGAVTTSSVRLVHAEDRAQEMARLLSGSPDSESALAHARELLEAAHGRWD